MQWQGVFLAAAVALAGGAVGAEGFSVDEEEGLLHVFNHGTLATFSPRTGTTNYLSFRGKPLVSVGDIDLVGGPRLYAEPAVVKYLPQPWKIGTNWVEIVSEVWFVDHTKARHELKFIFEDDGSLNLDSHLEQFGTNTLQQVGLEWATVPQGIVERRQFAVTNGVVSWRQAFSRKGAAAKPKEL